MRIAIMQPYFVPYAGYFRLFSSTDLFIIYDCVQFTRRGWIHRNQLTNQVGELSWLTLPLFKGPRDILISELKFADDASSRMTEHMAKFPLFATSAYKNSVFYNRLTDFSLSPVTYITQLLKMICGMINIQCHIFHSSELNIPSNISGQNRIIAIAKHFQATTYINAPGGKDLYDEQSFKQNKIKLQFLSGYQGPTQSILERILNENNISLRKEIISQSIGR